jgi:ABC-2 type transport system ATP-binding protein
VIRIENLVKNYGRRRAVDGISFNVEKGEIVGFLGPNGAGKTTTMRIITGYLMPTSGEVRVAEHDMATRSLEGRRLIGYMPEIVPLYTDMTTRAYLEYVGRLRGLDAGKARARIDRVVEICRLEEYIDVILGKLSKGFRQRVGLAQAIIHEPQVLILDEPTVGIDPIQVAQTRELIRELGKEHTILLSTHILPEVSMICERVIIIHQGRIVAQDRIENLTALLKGANRIRLRVQGPGDEVTRRLREIDGVRSVSFEKPYHVVDYPSDREPRASITESIVRSGWTLLTMESVEMSLEEVFLELTTEGGASDGAKEDSGGEGPAPGGRR